MPTHRGAGGAVRFRDVLGRFRHESPAVRLQLRLRQMFLHADRIEREVPPSGRILDAGCGFGATTMLMALAGPGRVVVGLDSDASRIEVAKRAGAGIPGLSFEVGDITAVRGEYDAIVVVDTLHSFPRQGQSGILRGLHSALRSGGTLVARQAVREGGLRHHWTRLHETVMLALSITRSSSRALHFPTVSELHSMYEGAGFTVERVARDHRLLPYADHLVIAKRRD